MWPEITGEARVNRVRLEALMRYHGFENFANEWWHFTFTRLKNASLVEAEIR